jgi:hypothetical protein
VIFARVAEGKGAEWPRGFLWTGPGAAAFALAGDAGASEGARWADSSAVEPAIARYFSAGGRGCIVLRDERLADGRWAGEDGGPGGRAGLHALAERDEVGLIAVLGPSSEARRAEVEALAGRMPEVFFLLEGAAERGIDFLAENAAVVPGGEAAALVGLLETGDPRAEPPFAETAVAPPDWLPRGDFDALRAWRLREGLRRSLDFGTRWTLAEVSGPSLWRGVEREVAAFLERLRGAGLLEPARGGSPFEVACGPETSKSGEVDPARIAIRVQVRLRAPARAVRE